MKKLIKPLPLLTAALLLTATIYAEETKDGFRLILQKYAENSPSYKTIELNHTQSGLDDYSDTYSLKSAESSVEDNENQIKSLENQLSNAFDYYEKEAIRINIEYRRIYQFELELNKAELEMQSEINSITAEFSENTLAMEHKKYEYELRGKLNQRTALKKQLDYLNLNEKYCADNVKITKSSLEIGYATQLDVENAEAQAKKAQAAVIECETQIEQLEKEIVLNSGETSEMSAYEFLREYDVKQPELLEQFKEMSCQEEISEKQIQSYRDLIDKIKDIQERLLNVTVTFSEDNAEYKERLSEQIDGALAYYEKALEIAENDLRKYEISLELYVSELSGRYNVCVAEVSAAEAALQATKTNIDVMNAFLTEGHIRELDMTEAYAQLEKAEYDLISAQIALDSVVFALQNRII